MQSVRRTGLLLGILFLGIFLGRLTFNIILLITVPISLLWFMNWDEKRYKKYTKKKENMAYRHN